MASDRSICQLAGVLAGPSALATSPAEISTVRGAWAAAPPQPALHSVDTPLSKHASTALASCLSQLHITVWQGPAAPATTRSAARNTLLRAQGGTGAGGALAVQVLLGEAVERGVQLQRHRPIIQAQRVQLGLEVAIDLPSIPRSISPHSLSTVQAATGLQSSGFRPVRLLRTSRSAPKCSCHALLAARAELAIGRVAQEVDPAAECEDLALNLNCSPNLQYGQGTTTNTCLASTQMQGCHCCVPS